MDATDALISLHKAPGDVTGYLIVVSPPIDPSPFILFRPLDPQNLTTFRGYWVFMDNADMGMVDGCKVLQTPHAENA